MISKKDIAKIAKRVFKHQRGVHDHQIIHPERDWFIGLSGGLLLLVLGSAWSVLTYRDVSDSGVENSGVSEVQQISYREDMITTALEKTNERQDNYQTLLDERKATQPLVEEVVDEKSEPEVEEEVVSEENRDQSTELPVVSVPEETPEEDVEIEEVTEEGVDG